jgi:hypothetical protein
VIVGQTIFADIVLVIAVFTLAIAIFAAAIDT